MHPTRQSCNTDIWCLHTCQFRSACICLCYGRDKLPAFVLIGSGCCERTGWCLIPILITVILAIIAVSFAISGRDAEWQEKLPPIPTAFTGRSRKRNSAGFVFFIHKECISMFCSFLSVVYSYKSVIHLATYGRRGTMDVSGRAKG